VRLTSSRGIVVPTAIAEYAIAGVFHFARGLHEAMRQQHAGQFDKRAYVMRTLAASTLGVVGLGGIGMEVARLGRAAGMRVVATRRSVTEPQHGVDFADLLLPADRLLDLAAQSDFLVVCSQLTDETRGFIDASVFAAMPAHAVLINVARGEQVDEDALIDALRSGSIGGALLDVFEGDLSFQPPRRELVELPGVVVTPHLSGLGASFAGEGRRFARENLRRFASGEPLLNEVDRARGY
jgi:phosphoglycerate dehydrogenase-like enzyme